MYLLQDFCRVLIPELPNSLLQKLTRKLYLYSKYFGFLKTEGKYRNTFNENEAILVLFARKTPSLFAIKGDEQVAERR